MGAYNYTDLSLVETHSPDNFSTPGAFGAQAPINTLPDTSTNFAEAPEVANQVPDIYSLISELRRQRQPLEEEWRAIGRMKMLLHDGSRRYYGRHDSYLPVGARIFQTLTTQLSRGLFPSDEYMDVMDRASGDPERARPVKAYVQWELEANAQLRRHIKPMLSQLVELGNTVWKRFYRRDQSISGQMQMSPMGVPTPSFGIQRNEGLVVAPRSIFSFYTWPTTAASLDECTLVAEDIDVPQKEVYRLIKNGTFLNGQAALDAPTPDTHLLQSAEVHTNLYGIPSPHYSTISGNPEGAMRTLTEVWTCIVMPAQAYLPFEDPSVPVPVRLVLAGNTCVECRRNPFLDQKPPYDFHATNQVPGMIYGTGYGMLAKALQATTNDAFNQWLDVAQYNLNPLWLVNPNLMAGPPPPIFPGAVVPVLDIEQAIKFDRPPFEMIQHGQYVVSYLRSLEEDLSGAPPQSQGNSSSQAKTATQSQILQRNSMEPLLDQVQDIEYAMMIPLLRATWRLGQQYRDKQVFAVVAGKSYPVTPADLIIDAEFRWLASSQAIAAAQRTQQIATLMQIAMNPAVLQILLSQGYIVDPAPMLERMYSTGGLRGFDSFIRKMTPQELMAKQMAAMAGPGAPPGQVPSMNGQPPQQPQNPGDRARSATEQAPGVGQRGTDATMGEGNEFMDVRQNADQLAALNGGNNQ